jgi:formylglycine-generating enzyme required for sulfatase activity
MSCGQSNFGKLLRSRFRVLRVLGEGGFSRTYQAEDADRLDAPCVIKQFFPQVQGTSERTKAAQLFKEEAFRLYELGENHQQIPRLLAFFEQGSCLYLVQEFIEGQTLLQELQQQPFTEKQIRELLIDLLPVLDFIHSHNVIHRDIKPENIIRRSPPRGDLVLIDFGGAKQVTQTSLAKQATVIYTIGYAPTEQMAGFAYPASDLYSLGVTCVRLLTQCLPTKDDSGQIHDLLYEPMSAQWLWRERLQERGVSINDEMGRILEKLLKHLPKERYQSATEVLKDLYSSPQVVVVKPLWHSQGQILTQPQETISAYPTLQSFEFDVVTVNATGTEISRQLRTAQFYKEDLGNVVTLEMIAIPGGTFMMGSSEDEGDADERPQHQVTVKPFFMGKFPITQTQWRCVAALPRVKQSLNPNPSKFKGINRPVENVSWHEAVEFCARLSTKTGRKYRLPSEAEWEYACRGGTTTKFHFGETITPELVNCSGNDIYAFSQYRKETTPVGSFKVANAFGLYDMHGLVWEWCADSWHKNYIDAPTDGTTWETGGDENRRVLRGGSWSFSPILCRSASRSWNEADGGLRVCGFRVVAS